MSAAARACSDNPVTEIREPPSPFPPPLSVTSGWLRRGPSTMWHVPRRAVRQLRRASMRTRIE